MSEMTRRSWIALGLAEVLFALTYAVCVAVALGIPATDRHDGWEVVTLLLAGAFAVVVGVPIGVHTVGRLTATWVRGWSSVAASLAHLVVGLGVGAIAAAVMIPLASMEPAVAAVAFALPAGVVGLGTNLLMPLAVRHGWIRMTAWVLGTMSVLGGMSLFPLLGFVN